MFPTPIQIPSAPIKTLVDVHFLQLQKIWVIKIQDPSRNTTVTALPKHKPLIGKPQTNGIRNHTIGRGSHNPWTNPNDSNYELEIL